MTSYALGCLGLALTRLAVGVRTTRLPSMHKALHAAGVRPARLRKNQAGGRVLSFAKRSKSEDFALVVDGICSAKSNSYATIVRCMGCKGSSVRITPSRPLLKRKSPVGNDWAFLLAPDCALWRTHAPSTLVGFSSAGNPRFFMKSGQKTLGLCLN